jgi:NAD(P)H-dependent FMN reductase
MTTRVLMICGSLQRASANRAALDIVRSYLLRSSDGPVDLRLASSTIGGSISS